MLQGSDWRHFQLEKNGMAIKERYEYVVPEP
jgi:hypothetical protein